MSPLYEISPVQVASFPRSRGDEPPDAEQNRAGWVFSPLTRG